ncbi:MAG: hypothetical protein WBA15_03390 [Mesorhizobium sp.]
MKRATVQESRLSLLMDPTDRWFIWDVQIDEPLSAKGNIISGTDYDEMAFVLTIFQKFHSLSAPHQPIPPACNMLQSM